MAFRGRGGARERMFEKGDLKYVLLDLLHQQPRHGYDLMRELEERFQGQYTASPGTVYPILQLLEDMGYLVAQAQEGRKIYTVTEAGRQFLSERASQVQEIWQRASCYCGSGSRGEIHALKDELHELVFSLMGAVGKGQRLEQEQVRRIREIVLRSKQEIARILDE